MELWGLVWSVAFIAGVIGNLAASILWASPAGMALVRKLDQHHAEHLAQAAQHHREAMTQATEQHRDLTQLAEKHHQQQLDRLEAHAEALKAHITVTAQSKTRRLP